MTEHLIAMDPTLESVAARPHQRHSPAATLILPALDQVLDSWALHMRAGNASPETVKQRLWNVRHVAHLLDPIVLLDATGEELLEVMGAQDWKPATRRAYRGALLAFFGFVQGSGIRDDDPTRVVPRVKMPRSVPRPTPELVLHDAIHRAWLAEDPQLVLMLRLAGESAMRRAEIARARREDLVADVVGEEMLLVHGKGGHERAVGVSPEAVAQILEVEDGWLFPSPSPRCPGRPVTPGFVGKRVSAALGGSWTCHTLRHRAATSAYRGSRDIRAVQEFLGHAKIDTTQIYTRVEPEEVRGLLAHTRLRP